MVITGVADHVPQPIRRLVYWNAFVPKDSECLNDLVPPLYVGLFDPAAAEQGNGSVMLPFPIWREAFINDGDLETAQRAYSSIRTRPTPSLTRFRSRPIRRRRRFRSRT